MGDKLSDAIGPALRRSFDDTPVHLTGVPRVVNRLAEKKSRDRDGVTSIDRIETAAVAGPRDGARSPVRHDGRDDRGRFTGDGNRPWVDRERIGLDNVAEREGVEVIRDHVASRHPSAGNQIRYFDGLFENADGTYTAIEVKSGSASRNPAQRLFDGAVSVEIPAIAHLPNRGPISIVQVILERVP